MTLAIDLLESAIPGCQILGPWRDATTDTLWYHVKYPRDPVVFNIVIKVRDLLILRGLDEHAAFIKDRIIKPAVGEYIRRTNAPR